MPYNTKRLKEDVDGRTVPQVFNPAIDDYDVLGGEGGASKHDITDRAARVLGKVTADDAAIAALGSLAAAAVTDPAAAASVIALLKGQLCHQPTVRTITSTPLAAGANYNADVVVDLTAAPGIAMVGYSVESDTPVKMLIDFTDGSGNPAFAVPPVEVTLSPRYQAGTQQFIPPFRPLAGKMRALVVNPTSVAQTVLVVKEYRYNVPNYYPQNMRGLFAYHLAIRDTSSHSNTTDTGYIFKLVRLALGGAKLPVFIHSTLDQAVTAHIWMQVSGGPTAELGSILVPANSNKVITNADFPGLDVPSEAVYLAFNCSAAPTTGVIDAYYDVMIGGSS